MLCHFASDIVYHFTRIFDNIGRTNRRLSVDARKYPQVADHSDVTKCKGSSKPKLIIVGWEIFDDTQTYS